MSSTVASASSTPPSPIARLYRDALYALLSMCSAHELALSIARVCRWWRQLAASCPPRRANLYIPFVCYNSDTERQRWAQGFRCLAAASLRVHFQNMYLFQMRQLPSDVLLLLPRFTHVIHLVLSLTLTQQPLPVFTLPARLQTLAFDVSRTAVPPTVPQAALDAAVELSWDRLLGAITACSELRSLSIRKALKLFEVHGPPPIQVEQPSRELLDALIILAPMPHLEELDIDSHDWTPAEIAEVLESKPRLTTLAVSKRTEIAALAAHPAAVRIRSIDDVDVREPAANVDEPSLADSLSRLRGLERLDVTCGAGCDLSFLPQLQALQALTSSCEGVVGLSPLSHLPNLIELTLELSGGDQPTSTAAVMVAQLSACTRLRKLCLRYVTLSHADIAALLAKLSHLESLELMQLERIRSLSFLARAPPTLTRLSLFGLQRMAPEELLHILHCHAVRSVSLRYCCFEAVPECVLQRLRPTTTPLPLLSSTELELPHTLGVDLNAPPAAAAVMAACADVDAFLRSPPPPREQ